VYELTTRPLGRPTRYVGR